MTYEGARADDAASPWVLGDLRVTSESIETPSGTFALRDVFVDVLDRTWSSPRFPVWAQAAGAHGGPLVFLAAVVFALVGRRRADRVVEVTLIDGERRHLTRLPSRGRALRSDALRRVADLQSRVERARRG
ncbi:hypothetical protein [Litorihabitans aurantiacus]|uniref:Uncharacterized protein n=1 Tax=Litorihabitans aurantiacus TaxID=1930061 RepID=A0AA38CRW2_9MICO|nr:hypothetical protein [Litorihabitans aurantiacus]GMA33173.1 hypothetical protein GCM10025875_31650 [Litorihabitans aurantiacus]